MTAKSKTRVVREHLIEKLCIPPSASLREAMTRINATGEGIVLVVDGTRRLLRTVSDGDVRRAILAGAEIDKDLRSLDEAAPLPHDGPVTAGLDEPDHKLISLLMRHRLRHLPLLDAHGVVRDICFLSDFLRAQDDKPLQGLVMAGGLGTRLHPLTLDTPKPMMQVGDKPVIERTLERMEQAGITEVCISTYFKPEKIIDYFGDGTRLGIKIDYVHEDEPLGTAGALGLLPPPDAPILVVNGDILTTLDFKAFHRFHEEHTADLTVAVRPYNVDVPFGIVESDGVHVTGIREKPTLSFFVNAGIYLVAPTAFKRVPRNERFDMTDLIRKIIEDGGVVANYPLLEYWMDIGRIEDLEKAKRELDEFDTSR